MDYNYKAKYHEFKATWLGPRKTRHGHLCSELEDGVAEGFRSSMGGGGGVGGGQGGVEGGGSKVCSAMDIYVEFALFVWIYFIMVHGYGKGMGWRWY